MGTGRSTERDAWRRHSGCAQDAVGEGEQRLAAFAKSIGVALGTLKNWEQGRRRPEGAARVLLALIDKRPSIVMEELGD